MLDCVAMLAEGLHDEIDVYHAREFTAVMLRRHPLRQCLRQDAINNAVGWMHVFSLLGGGVPWGVPWLFSPVGEGAKSLKLGGSVDSRSLSSEETCDLKRHGPEKEISWRVGLRGGVGLGDCAGLRGAGVGG